MNLTVIVSHHLREAVEGRRRLELGVPRTADVGDVVETLLSLYPKLGHFLANERSAERRQLNIYWGDGSGRRGDGFRDGQRLYLLALKPKRGGKSPVD